MTFNIVLMAKVLNVSRSGFYYWLKNRHKVTERKAALQSHNGFCVKITQSIVDIRNHNFARPYRT